MEKYRAAPTDAEKKELLAQIGRMKERVKDLLARMAELSKGFNDEHMNAEALAELAKSQDLVARARRGREEARQGRRRGRDEGARPDGLARWTRCSPGSSAPPGCPTRRRRRS